MADLTIQISDLRTRITLQAPTEARDAGGAQTVTYADIGINPTIWVKWVNDHGQETVASEAKQAIQRATVQGRYRSDLLSTWRVLKDGEPWNILSVDPLQNRRWFELRVERVKGTV